VYGKLVGIPPNLSGARTVFETLSFGGASRFLTCIGKLGCTGIDTPGREGEVAGKRGGRR
jgi:hypothetical protein